MEIKTKQDSDVLYLYIKGRIDVSTIDELSSVISLIPSNTKKVIIDFSQLQYISSVGLRELLRLRKSMSDGNDITVEGCNETIIEIFKKTGFDNLINIIGNNVEESPESLSIKDLFIKQVQRMPQKTFVSADRTYTYEDIYRYSHIIALDLFKEGVHKGTHVGIYGSNNVNWIAGFFAIQKLGGIAMPLNSQYTVDDLVLMSQIGDITHLLVGDINGGEISDEFRTMVTDNGSQIQCVIDISSKTDYSLRDGEYEHIADQFKEPLESDDDCCMLFSSGSTGRPKAVLHSSSGILHSAKCNVGFTRMTEEDKICMNVPLFHTTGLIRGFLAALYAGASIHIPEDFETGTLLSFISEQKCTIMNAITGTIFSMVNDTTFSEDKVASLRCSILTGVPATETQMHMLMEKMPGNHFISSYGMSELSPISATEYGDTVEHICRSVGKAAEGVTIEILDFDTGNTLPPGEANRGEIAVQGSSAMTAYYKLSPESQALDNKGRIRTGDFGFLDTDGYLHISGRMKELIHCGSRIIEPNAVGNVIAEYEPVADVKVVGVTDEKDGEVAVACITLKNADADQLQYSETALLAFLNNRLEDYQIPRKILLYDNLPLLANGKVDTVTLKQDAQKLI